MLKRTLLRWVIGIITVLITVQLIKVLSPLGAELKWPDMWRVVIFVPVLALANTVIAPILKFFSVPITCMTLGLFAFIINALVFWIAGWATGAIMNFWGALFGSILVSLISAPLNQFTKESK